MKSHTIGTALAAAAALTLAACSITAAPPAHHPAASSHAATHSTAPSSPSAAQAAKAAAATNDRNFVYGIAASTATIPALRADVAGPVMLAYATDQAIVIDAAASTGSPFAESVNTIPGGYQECGGNGNGGTSCDSFTAFQHNAAGRITGMSVDGQPVAGRIATGPSDHGPGLTITHTVAYRPGGSNEVNVVFIVKDTGSAAYSLSPPWLATFAPTSGGSYSEDDINSVTPSNLQPGESAAVDEVFATSAVTGTLRLLTNDQTGTVLASTTLTKP
jgi:hypothetical protein